MVNGCILHERFGAVLRARTRDELLVGSVQFAQRMGFATVSAIAILDGPDGVSRFERVDNTPAGFYESFADMAYVKRDPISCHCKRGSAPIVWDEETYTSAGEGERWELQASFGYRAGIALANHLPCGRHFFVGVDRDQALPRDEGELARMVGELSLFAAFVQDVVFDVVSPTLIHDADGPGVTARELECLRWTMEGKTAWEVGRILGISEQTAVRHLNNATHKLGCVNKHHAVVKALRLGLVQ